MPAHGEGGRGRRGVVAGPVELAVDRPLRSAAQRVNSAAAASVEADRYGVFDGCTSVARTTSPANTPARTAMMMVGDHPADDVVDRIRPVFSSATPIQTANRYPEVEKIAASSGPIQGSKGRAGQRTGRIHNSQKAVAPL